MSCKLVSNGGQWRVSMCVCVKFSLLLNAALSAPNPLLQSCPSLSCCLPASVPPLCLLLPTQHFAKPCYTHNNATAYT